MEKGDGAREKDEEVEERGGGGSSCIDNSDILNIGRVKAESFFISRGLVD